MSEVTFHVHLRVIGRDHHKRRWHNLIGFIIAVLVASIFWGGPNYHLLLYLFSQLHVWTALSSIAYSQE